MVESVFTLAGAKVEHGEGYPGWAPNPDSPVVKVAVDSYKRLFGKEPIVRSIHAGLECGLFLEKDQYQDGRDVVEPFGGYITKPIKFLIYDLRLMKL